MDLNLSPSEERAIKQLKRIAKNWPETLWLFSCSGTLLVMKTNEDGEKAFDGESVDREYTVDHIYGIENDGGDF